MTTIAANLKEMAADSRTSDDCVYFTCDSKITRHGKDIIGCCGNLDSIAKFLAWYETKGDAPEFEGDDFEAIVLRHEGLFFYSNSTRCKRITDPFFAVGSGAMGALAALHCGKSPKAAVETAIKCDKNSGPPVIVERLKR